MSGRTIKGMQRMGDASSIPLDPAAKKHKDDIDKIQQDITVLSQRIADAKGELPAIGTRLPDVSSSSIASSVRGLSDSERRVRDLKEMKLTSMEQLLERIAEYDRIILSKTVPETTQNQRRKSFGSDLFTIPTHLRVIDRLLDVYTQSQRVTVIKTTVNGGSKPPTPSNANDCGLKLPPIVNLGKTPDTNSQQVEQNERLIEQLNDKIDQTERRYRFSEQQYQDLKVLHNNLEKENQMLREKMAQIEREHGQALAQAKEEAVSLAKAASSQQHQQSNTQQLTQQVHILQQQCQSLQEQLLTKEKDCAEKDEQLKKKESFLQSQVKHWQEQEQRYLMEQHESQTSVSASEDQYQSLTAQYKQLEGRLDIEMQQNSQYIHRLQSLIASIQYYHANTSAMTSPTKASRATQQFPTSRSTGNQEADKLFQQVDSLLHQYHHNIQQEYGLLLSVKDVLEQEVQSHVVQKDMIQSDFTVLQGDYDALKAAYHSLSYETATGSNKSNSNTKTNTNTSSSADTQKELDSVKKQLSEAQLTMNKQGLDLRDQLSIIQSLETQISSLQIKEIANQTTIRTQADEIDNMKIVLEKYKQKIKDLSAASGNAKKDKDFFDTFEEVMQDEMMTMKSAFEKKLKAAREEADLKSKIHLQEIQKLQQTLSNSASSTSLKRF